MKNKGFHLLLFFNLKNLSFLIIKTASGQKKICECKLATTNTHRHSSDWVGEDKSWPPRPLLGAHSRLDTQLRAEADQLAWAYEQRRWGVERKEPSIPNYSKLFCWLTDFISDQQPERKTGGLKNVTEDRGGRRRLWMGTGWRPRWQSTALVHIWIWSSIFRKRMYTGFYGIYTMWLMQ